MRSSPRRCARLLVVVAALAVATTGCVSLPESGSVTSADPATGQPERGANYYYPPPPKPGASQVEIVRGFLDAMRETPISPRGAELYLTSDYRELWNPDTETVTYAPGVSPERQGDDFTVDLVSADHLDADGRWLGRLSSSRSKVRFHLRREKGEWRIDHAPDALIVPESWFTLRYTQKSLYCFDATGNILVPEPVFVPSGPQLATSLVQGLLAGPCTDPSSPSLQGFFPRGSTPGLSVPVSSDGVVDVVLSGEVGAADQVRRLTAQLVWTLRQDTSISELSLSIGGQQIELSGGRTRVSVRGSPEYDPAGFAASDTLFGLRSGVIVAGDTPTELEPVAGPLRRVVGLRSVAVDLRATQAAGVSRDGSRLLLGPLVAGQRGADGRPAAVRAVVSGRTDLLRPAWDFGNHLWYVDRAGGRAEVGVAAGRAGTHRVMTVPGITGHDVRHFLVSRDGSRLVAVVHRKNADVVLVSRIRHDDQNVVLGLTPARPISLPDGVRRIQDIGWGSPTTLVLLSRLATSAVVRTISIDGAPTGFETEDVTVSALNTSLVTSPSNTESDTQFVLTRCVADCSNAADDGLFPLSGAEAASLPISRGVTDLHYAG